MVNCIKNTLIIGASLNPQRYSYKATIKLIEKKIKVFLVGKKRGKIKGFNVYDKFPKRKNIDTISIYIKPKNQSCYTDEIIDLSPRRIIFNPGTENPALFKKFTLNGIACENSCTLVLLSTNQY